MPKPTGIFLSQYAAPSWVVPGSIAENALFLSGRAAEIGLCFFETKTCLAYGENDLPRNLANLPLSWHVHLPLDLPWFEKGGIVAADIAVRLMDKVSFLNVCRAVIHLPEGLGLAGSSAAAAQTWEVFLSRWQDSGRRTQDLLLENQLGEEPSALLDLTGDCGVGLCLDFSHWLLTLGPEIQPDQEFLHRVRLVHINAPGGNGGGHAGLNELMPTERAWAAGVLRVLLASQGRPSGIGLGNKPLLMLEMFAWDKIVTSLPLLQAWLGEMDI